MGSGADPPPPPLVDLAARFCMSNLVTTLASKTSRELREGIVLPSDLCERLLDVADKESERFEAFVVPLFKDTSRTRLRVVNVRNALISDASFATLMKHKPMDVDIHNCARLTSHSLETINQHASNLVSLCIGNSMQILPESLNGPDGLTLSEEGEMFVNRGCILDAHKLRKLVVWGHHVQSEPTYWRILIPNYENLTHLDLSNCLELEDLSFLEVAKNLVFLCLYNVTLRVEGFAVLRKLTKLRHLDISQSSENASIYREPNELLASVVEQMPYLTSLDISGTNLAGRGVAQRHSASQTQCDILGLNSRVNTPLEFLGLYSTHHDASHRHHIPAKKIAGDKDELQILTACQAYLDRHEVLEKVLNDLFHLFRGERGSDVQQSLCLILEAMARHLGEKHVQISGSASLFYIVKHYEAKSNIGAALRRKILSTLIEAMEVHKFDSTMMRNGCLTICLFKIPLDVMFKYEKLVRLLLDILGATGGHATQEDFVERVAIYLLNSLACQVEGEHKQLVGDLGAIQKMLGLIQERLAKNECDDVMEIAWSTMWNVTDETAENCQRFLRGEGMQLFLNCLNTFPNKPELLRNMMGLLGNVAEVAALRPQLMTTDFVSVFYTLLDSTQDNIEVSYNAAGVLAHILSDGVEAWKIETPTREDVLERMKRNIMRWDINSQRNINYRSFEPILRLLTIQHTGVCQLWAAWALANLTRVYPNKYCPLLEKEGGIELLLPLIVPSTFVAQYYASLAVDHVRQFKETGSVSVPVLELDG